MRVRLDGLNEFRRMVSNLTEEVQQDVRELVRETTLGIEADAKNLAPVDTGNLRRNIKSKITGDGLTGEVTSHAEYGMSVEFGTSKSPAQPYFMPAWERNTRNFKNDLRNIVER